ncbi:MAG: response regulator transcription factor [Pseudomonadota bacterium]|nr:response regulator transcription factor [Burkholderiales bacterium]MDQ3195425.1 response regulator transcription factor [Pseudomonadota bacterium]
MRILIVEDDRDIAANLYDYLESRGHVVDAAADGVTGLHLAVTADFDALLLDLNLPVIDGLTLCRRLREDAGRDTPVLMLTARDTLADKLDGFAQGADDYLVKPFALREVEARLLALHKRRSGKVADPELRVGELVFDTDRLKIVFAGEPVRLPPKSMRLLECMMARPHHVFSRAELELAIWGEEQATSDTLRSHMHTLRRALARAGGFDPIESVHGIGYRLVAHNAH